MPTFKGTHGTTVYRAKKIAETGFEATKQGRAGQGVYFWQFHQFPSIAHQLAVGWFKQQNRRSLYRDDPCSPQCAVIYGSFMTHEDDVLDCSNEVLEQITAILMDLQQQADSSKSNYTDLDIHTAYEYVVTAIEQKRSAPVIVVKTTVAPPANIALKERIVLGNPAVIVIRQNIEKIQISNIQEVEEVQ